LEEKVDEELLP